MDFNNKVISYSYNTRILLAGTGCQVVFIDVFQNFFQHLSVFFCQTPKIVFGTHFIDRKIS